MKMQKLSIQKKTVTSFESKSIVAHQKTSIITGTLETYSI